MEIQFRAWDGKAFIYSYIFKVNGDTDNDVMSKFFDHIIGCEIQQFTGREDSEINGTPVYDGDIIENCDTKYLQIVYWDTNKCAWYCRYIYDCNRTVSLADSLGNFNKVIGNIHENPELLNQ